MLGIAGAMLSASPAVASDKGTIVKKSSQNVRNCRKVNVAAMSKTNDAATNATERESYFNNDFSAQHPSGGG